VGAGVVVVVVVVVDGVVAPGCSNARSGRRIGLRVVGDDMLTTCGCTLVGLAETQRDVAWAEKMDAYSMLLWKFKNLLLSSSILL
jgi:hypothetical protein